MIAASQTRSLFDSSSSRDWVITFAKNTQRWRQFARGLDFDTLRLEPELIESIKIFQLGEQGEGRTLTALAKQHAQQHDDPNYLSAIQQFIGEEQRHAGYIAKALQAKTRKPSNYSSAFYKMKQFTYSSTANHSVVFGTHAGPSNGACIAYFFKPLQVLFGTNIDKCLGTDFRPIEASLIIVSAYSSILFDLTNS